jgi:hypothetical protein
VALAPERLAFPAGVRLVPLAGVELVSRVDLVLPLGHAARPAARRFVELVSSP